MIFIKYGPFSADVSIWVYSIISIAVSLIVGLPASIIWSNVTGKKEEPAPQPAPSIPEPAADVPEEEQVELEPAFFEQRPAPVPEEVQEPTLEFQANVSNFDEF